MKYGPAHSGGLQRASLGTKKEKEMAKDKYFRIDTPSRFWVVKAEFLEAAEQIVLTQILSQFKTIEISEEQAKKHGNFGGRKNEQTCDRIGSDIRIGRRRQNPRATY